MKKSLLSIFTLIFLQLSLQAQMIRCSTFEHQNQLEAKYPWVKTNRDKIERDIQKIASRTTANKSTTVITIPVVVHVVWKNAAQNISATVIQAQIDQLNADYARLNSDTGNTPAVFQSVAANSTVQFCLAQQDPNGQATTGIVRKQTTKTTFIDDDKVKYTAQGGDDAWPMNQYLNIWSCNLGNSLLGYAQFPGGPAATDGVVFLYSSLGSIASPASSGAPFNLGRTATHEIGHWLNLYHINGDANCGDDLVSDTPTQDQLHFGCFTAPYHVDNCGTGESPDGEMFMNYMDYTNDACMNLFTLGQKSRILATLNGTRAGLLTSQGCQAPSFTAYDAGISAITAPSGVVCSSAISPVVSIHNYGVTALTSVTINYQIDAGVNNSYSWSTSGAGISQGSSINVTLPSISVSTGSHTLTVSTSNPNSMTDTNTVNDLATITFSFVSGVALPVSEGIENASFPPTNWVISNPDNSTTWTRTTTASKSGAASMYIDNANYSSGNGQIDEVIMLPLDLTTVPSPHLDFQVAYTFWTTPYQYSDTLQVLVSSDCGSNWNSMYKKWGTTLATAPGQASDFIPTASQWRLETLDLTNYASSSNVLVKFRNISDFENNLYIDDINLYSLTGMNELSNVPIFSVSPNPSKGIFNFIINQKAGQNSSLKIYNMLGKVVYQSIQNESRRPLVVDLSELPKGIYHAELANDAGKTSKKIVLQ